MITFSIFLSMIMLGMGLSMDSLALSISCGIKPIINKKIMAIKVAFIFALVQSTTPLIGYFIGYAFIDQIDFLDHWIALLLLSIIGGHMIYSSFKDEEYCVDKNLSIISLFIMGIATSIDALAAGVSLIATDFNIPLIILIIFLCTVIFSLFGFYFGNKLGLKFQQRAELFGGIVLIILGIKIVIEHIFL